MGFNKNDLYLSPGSSDNGPCEVPSGLLADHYQVLHELRRGGCGSVHVAKDGKTDALVALKVTPGGIWSDDVTSSFQEMVTRWRELPPHPHLVRLRDGFLVPQRGRFLSCTVWDLEDGSNLTETGLDVQSLWRTAEQLLHAIDHLHIHGLTHGDIQAANVLVGQTGDVKLCDPSVFDATGPQQADSDSTRQAVIARDVRAYIHLVSTLVEQSDADVAFAVEPLRELGRLYETEPGASTSCSSSFLARELSRLRRDAERSMDKAVQIAEDCYRSGRHSEALTCYERILKVAPEAPEVLQRKAELIKRRTEADDAYAALPGTMEQHSLSESCRALRRLRRLFGGHPEESRSRRVVAHRVQRHRDDRRRAGTLIADGQLSRAADVLEHCGRRHPDSPALPRRLAKVRAVMQLADAAKQAVQAALDGGDVAAAEAQLRALLSSAKALGVTVLQQWEAPYA